MKNSKTLRIVVGINSLTESQWPAYNSHLQLFYRLGRDFPKAEMCLYNPSRVGIDRMRNGAAAQVRQGDFDYLLFVDDDVVPPSQSLQRLLACKADIAAGDVIIRGYPFDHMCFRYVGKKKETLRAMSKYPKNSTVIDVDAVGFSLCLIKRELLEKVPEPFFITGTNHTEDVYFCLKARDFAPDCTIRVDTQLTCGHILWPEVISSWNKKLYKQYFEKQNPATKQIKPTTDLKIVRVNSDVNYSEIFKIEKELQ